MKFNTKNAVSGIQGQMNDNVNNRTIESVLKGIATGGVQMGQMKVAQNQVGNVNKYLGEQLGSFDTVLNDPGASKTEKLFANMKKQQLGLMKAGLTLGNVNDVYTQLIKPDMSMFNYQAGIDKANIMASAYGAKNAAKAEQDAKLNDFLNRQASSQSQGAGFGGLFGGIKNAVGGVMQNFGQGAGVSGGLDVNMGY